jgi:cobalt-zinc-cadmium resistance protein CzcA
LDWSPTPRDIGNVVDHAREGVPIYVRDVAEVKEAPGLRFGAVTRDGKEVTLGIALARINENAKNVVDAVKQKLKLAQQALPGRLHQSCLRPYRTRRQRRSRPPKAALLEGSILVAIVLFLFLGEIRSAIVVVVTCRWRC